MAGRKKKDPNKVIPVEDYEHSGAKRTNNPPAGLAHLDREKTPVKQLQYDPHLDPQLIWAGKQERLSVDVPAPSIHVHEELSAQKIVGAVRQQRTQQSLFDVNLLDPDQAVEFYRHDLNWTNRMILGDSLSVLMSLVERERMAGQAQCVYIDPPYGIKYNSNFQPRISERAVKDGDDDSLTREPEMIQAYRDTWELGVHSYLSYLRDRLKVAQDLLNATGSVFVQISDDNMHLVRNLMDEVFGSENFVAVITFQKTMGATAELLGSVCDYLIWYAKDRSQIKYRQLYTEQSLGAAGTANYNMVDLPDGSARSISRGESLGVDDLPDGARAFKLAPTTSARGAGSGELRKFVFEGRSYTPKGGSWKTHESGLRRLADAGRLHAGPTNIYYKRYLDDFGQFPITNVWTDLVSGFMTDKVYVVQTNVPVVERCILMTTDPGDLVIDPTCGSGTTAFASEKFGRRWITVDTSRVALAIARERLLTSRFEYFVLADEGRGVASGFKFATASRVTLGSIANDQAPDEIALVDKPLVAKGSVRVSGPFTVEAMSRYSIDPSSETPARATEESSDHVEVLLGALRTQGIPRPGKKPAKITSLTELAAAGPLQAEGILDADGKPARFAVSLGPRFGAVTMAQVSDALRSAIGFDLVVFAGFAVSADAQEKLGAGKIGGTDVALLLANPDLLVGDLLKNTKASQTFRLYSAPDVKIDKDGSQFRVTVEGVDSFDAATGEVMSFGKSGISAWFLDDEYDGTVFRVSQAFFPVSNAWEKLARALRGTVDAELVEELHSWTSLPFSAGESGRIAVRVVSNDGNASEVVMNLAQAGEK